MCQFTAQNSNSRPTSKMESGGPVPGQRSCKNGISRAIGNRSVRWQKSLWYSWKTYLTYIDVQQLLLCLAFVTICVCATVWVGDIFSHVCVCVFGFNFWTAWAVNYMCCMLMHVDPLYIFISCMSIETCMHYTGKLYQISHLTRTGQGGQCQAHLKVELKKISVNEPSSRLSAT